LNLIIFFSVWITLRLIGAFLTRKTTKMKLLDFINYTSELSRRNIKAINLTALTNFMSLIDGAGRLSVLKAYRLFIIMIIVSFFLSEFTPISSVIFSVIIAAYCVLYPFLVREILYALGVSRSDIDESPKKMLNKKMMINFAISLISIAIAVPAFNLLLSPAIFLNNQSMNVVVNMIIIYALLALSVVISDMGIILQINRRKFDIEDESTESMILYLRSFGDTDNKYTYYPFPDGFHYMKRFIFPFSRFEELITSLGLNTKSSDIIAIGRPEDKLPPLGAMKSYLSDKGTRWKSIVKKTAAKVENVIMVAGTVYIRNESKTGFAEELNIIRECELLQKTIILFQPDDEEQKKTLLLEVLIEIGVDKQQLENVEKSIIPQSVVALTFDEKGDVIFIVSNKIKWSTYCYAMLVNNGGSISTDLLNIVNGFDEPQEGQIDELPRETVLRNEDEKKDIVNLPFSRPQYLDRVQKSVLAKVFKARLLSKKQPEKAAEEYRRILHEAGPSLRIDCRVFLLFEIVGCMCDAGKMMDVEEEMFEIIESCDKFTWAWLGDVDFCKTSEVKAGVFDQYFHVIRQKYPEDKKLIHSVVLTYVDVSEADETKKYYGHANYYAGIFEREIFDYDNAVEHLLIALEHYKSRGNLFDVVNTLYYLADICRVNKDIDNGTRYAEDAFRRIYDVGDFRMKMRITLLCVSLSLAANDTAQYRFYNEKIIELCKEEIELCKEGKSRDYYDDKHYMENIEHEISVAEKNLEKLPN